MFLREFKTFSELQRHFFPCLVRVAAKTLSNLFCKLFQKGMSTRKECPPEKWLLLLNHESVTNEKEYLKFFYSFFSSIGRECLIHKLRFSNLYIFVTQYCRPKIFQTMISVRSNYLSLKYLRFSPLGCKHLGVRKSEFNNSVPFYSTKWLKSERKAAMFCQNLKYIY